MNRRINNKSYSLTEFEQVINATVHWFFFYRMILVLAMICSIVLFAVIIWRDSPSPEKTKNLATILACGSIVIGIFYTVLNYEINYHKYKKDRMLAIKQTSFQIASDWHKDSIVRHLKTTKKIYEQYKHLIDENSSKEFSELLDSDEDIRAALISILNYLECIALGISEGILDEFFIREFFKGIFINYLNDYDFYIQYRRKKYNNANMWIKFTQLASKWRN